VSLKTRQVMVAITREALLLQAPRISQLFTGLIASANPKQTEVPI
jgi:type IV secretory pathway TrbD component